VAFTSEATNLVTNDANQVSDIFVHDMSSGVTVCVSTALNGGQADAASNAASVSGTGQYIAFQSRATNLVSGDTNGVSDIFLRDTQGATTERISVSASGAQADGASEGVAISEDGRFVAFASAATNLVTPADTNNVWDVFVRDRLNSTVLCASVSTSGAQGDAQSIAPAIAADGSVVAFESDATNLVAGDTNDCSDVFVRDFAAGTTTRVSVGPSGAQANGRSTHPSISADGRYVAFLSYASNLVTGDTNGAPDVFVYDRQAGTTTRVTVSTDGGQSDKAATWPALSRDGRFVSFPSRAAQLVAGNSNGEVQVFVRGPLF
jgi:Tol biopolymer transport system component